MKLEQEHSTAIADKERERSRATEVSSKVRTEATRLKEQLAKAQTEATKHTNDSSRIQDLEK